MQFNMTFNPILTENNSGRERPLFFAQRRLRNAQKTRPAQAIDHNRAAQMFR